MAFTLSNDNSYVQMEGWMDHHIFGGLMNGSVDGPMSDAWCMKDWLFAWMNV